MGIPIGAPPHSHTLLPVSVHLHVFLFLHLWYRQQGMWWPVWAMSGPLNYRLWGSIPPSNIREELKRLVTWMSFRVSQREANLVLH